jgi:predicted DNA-binding transcriptional regulator AlpA
MRQTSDRESEWVKFIAQPTTNRDDGRARAVILRSAPIPTLWRYERRTSIRTLVIPDPRGRPVMTADEVFAELDIDRATGYKAIRDGSFPLPVVRVGRSIRIPTAALRRLLELDEPDSDTGVEVAVARRRGAA